jgi:poly-beta-1,6-N-acetyl-D-glucosamine synthase
MPTAAYVIISPVRNEEEHLPLTIQSVRTQTALPRKWVLVNDGSNDGTGTIADAAARECNWIRALHRPDRGFRKPGGGVIESFYDGLRAIGTEPWDFLVKLDGDLSFANDYFARCLRHFEEHPRLGITGGTVCCFRQGMLDIESKIDPRFHVRGATKIYRQACWRDIGGLLESPGWDTLDEVKANMLGWDTYTLAEVRLTHHRPAGGASGAWKNWVKNGRANYVAGYHPLFMLAKCFRRMWDRPYLLASCGLLAGFVGGYLQRIPQVDDQELIRYFRQQQIRRLLLKKSLWG